MLRCAPEGAAAPRVAREHPRGKAWPPAGGAGGLQGTHARDTSTTMLWNSYPSSP